MDKAAGKPRRFGFHLFDKASGRCECGRWAPGRKPKVSPEDDGRCECQVCANHQKTDRAGKLVLHGYQRPGWGYIVGECYGVSALPFPATDRLEAWLVAVEGRIEHLTGEIAKLPTLETIEVPIRVWVGRVYENPKDGTKDGYKTKRVTVSKAASWPDYTRATIGKSVLVNHQWEKDPDDKSPEAEAVRHGYASFAKAVEHVEKTLRSHLVDAKAELQRVSDRIAKGKALQAAAKAADLAAV
jgi:hypothetical protein